MAKRKPFLLRIDPRPFDALQSRAADELRSVYGQVEYLLLEAVKKAGRWKPKKESKPPEEET